MRNITRALALTAALAASSGGMAQAANSQPKPTIVLVHGAFAESSSWDAVITKLSKDGYVAIAAANPLRALPAMRKQSQPSSGRFPGRSCWWGIPMAGLSSPRPPMAIPM